MGDTKLDLLRSLEEAGARSRRRALAASWTAVATAALAMLGLVAYSGRRIANETKQLEAVRAERAAVNRERSALQSERDRLRAEIATLAPLVENYRAAAADASAAAMKTREVHRSPSTTTTPSIDTVPPAVRPRVYLQIVDPADEKYAKDVGRVLERAGFTVLGVEYVRGAARLKNTEVRYYKRVDEPDAVRLLEALRVAGAPSATLLYLNLENNTRVRPRHYEVWLASDPARNPERGPSGSAEPPTSLREGC